MIYLTWFTRKHAGKRHCHCLVDKKELILGWESHAKLHHNNALKDNQLTFAFPKKKKTFNNALCYKLRYLEYINQTKMASKIISLICVSLILCVFSLAGASELHSSK